MTTTDKKFMTLICHDTMAINRLPLFLYYFLFLLITPRVEGSNPDTVSVFSHKQVYITTNPSTGTNPYPAWTLFPSKESEYRKVILRVTFECPQKLMCAEWDYNDHIYIRSTGGKNNPSSDIEISRMLTPYGRRFNSDWKFTWETDITDFAAFLHDSTEVEYLHSGYEPNNDRGWRISLEFVFILGKPVMRYLSMQKLYDGNFRYGDSLRSIEQDLVPFKVVGQSSPGEGVLRILQTGHGMDEKEGCSEFCAKWRNVVWDKSVVDHRLIWKECASNPLFPQAGTWIFDRANWCPGELNQPDRYFFRLDTGTHWLDVDMQPYIAPNPSASYSISAYFFRFKKPDSKIDASLEKILIPSQEDFLSRLNPSAQAPVIRISNPGSATIQNMRIEYGFQGNKVYHYNWTGKLFSHEWEEIELPAIPLPVKQALLQVRIRKVNHWFDAYPADNLGTSLYKPVPVYPSGLILLLRTNREPWQTSSFLADASGNLLFQHLPSSLDSLKLYADTVKLKPGYYHYQVSDTAGDGLEFWYNTAAGRGITRILTSDGQLLRDFNPDFGNFTGCWFRVSDQEPFVVDTVPVLEITPIRTRGKFTVDAFFSQLQPYVQVQVLHPDGWVVMSKFFYDLKEGFLPMDMSEQPDGIYTVRIATGKNVYLRRVKIAH